MRGARELFVGVVLAFAALAAPAQPDEFTKEGTEKAQRDAAALYRSGKPAEALALLERLLAFHRRGDDRRAIEDALYARGILLAKSGERARALESFTESLAIARERRSDGEAAILYEIGHLHVESRRFAEAALAFGAERALHKGRGDQKAEAEAAHNLAFVEAAQSRHEAALALFDEALALRRAAGDRAGEGSSLELSAAVQRRAGQPREALKKLEQALVIWRSLGDSAKADATITQIARAKAAVDGPRSPPTDRQRALWSEANDKHNECLGLIARGDAAGAEPGCKRALELARASGHRGGEAMVLNTQGVLRFMRGDHAGTREAALQAVAIARETGDEETMANALNNLALVHMAAAQYGQALALFERVLRVWRSVNDLGAEARTLGNIAGVQVALGRYAEAAEVFERQLRRPMGLDRASLLLNLSAIDAQRKDFGKARERLLQALALQRARGDPLLRTTLANLGAVHGELGEHHKAVEWLEEALAIDRQLGDRSSEVGTTTTIAEIRSRQGQHEQAMSGYTRALSLAREMGVPSIESRVHAGIGRVHERQGRLQPALDAYRQSIEIEDRIRAGGQIEEIKSALAERSIDVYRRATRVLVQLGRAGEAFEMSERARGRSFLDQLGQQGVDPGHAGSAEAQQERQARLALASLGRLLAQEKAKPAAQQDAARIDALASQLAAQRRGHAELLRSLQLADPERASLVTPPAVKLADVQRLLDGETTLLSYFVTDTQTLAFVVARDSITATEIKVGEQPLQEVIEEWRGFADVGGGASPLLERLSTWLIDPLRAQLKTPRLAVVPHGPLHLLPFAALRGGARDRFLADDHLLFQLPSASVWPFLQAKRKASRGDALVLGQGHAPGLPPLRQAEKEAQAIAALFGVPALIGAAATETALREGVARAGVLHIAAHGQLNATAPLFSRLVLAAQDDLDTRQDGMLEVHEIYGLDLRRASLVVLSACQSQLGARSLGDDIVGLARAFMHAGSPAVLASLWPVDDAATAALMTSFYGHLRQGVGSAAALRAAQLELRKRYPDPYHWAAFVLTGDPS